MKRPTTVTWTLAATAAGTHVELEHSGLGQGVLGQGVLGHVLKLMLRGGWGRMLRGGLPRTIGRRAGQDAP